MRHRNPGVRHSTPAPRIPEARRIQVLSSVVVVPPRVTSMPLLDAPGSPEDPQDRRTLQDITNRAGPSSFRSPRETDVRESRPIRFSPPEPTVPHQPDYVNPYDDPNFDFQLPPDLANIQITPFVTKSSDPRCSWQMPVLNVRPGPSTQTPSPPTSPPPPASPSPPPTFGPGPLNEPSPPHPGIYLQLPHRTLSQELPRSPSPPRLRLPRVPGERRNQPPIEFLPQIPWRTPPRIEVREPEPFWRHTRALIPIPEVEYPRGFRIYKGDAYTGVPIHWDRDMSWPPPEIDIPERRRVRYCRENDPRSLNLRVELERMPFYIPPWGYPTDVKNEED